MSKRLNSLQVSFEYRFSSLKLLTRSFLFHFYLPKNFQSGTNLGFLFLPHVLVKVFCCILFFIFCQFIRMSAPDYSTILFSVLIPTYSRTLTLFHFNSYLLVLQLCRSYILLLMLRMRQIKLFLTLGSVMHPTPHELYVMDCTAVSVQLVCQIEMTVLRILSPVCPFSTEIIQCPSFFVQKTSKSLKPSKFEDS